MAFIYTKEFFRLTFATMKFLFTLLAFFMVYLSCLPCGDSVECNSKAQTKISAATSHQDHQHNNEVCTPFCTCTCCAASAFYSANSKTDAVKSVFSSEKYPLFNIAFHTESYDNIWQPPKIA